MQYFNQILTAVLEVLDDNDSSIREVALSLINEMLKNQVCYMLISFISFLSNEFITYVPLRLLSLQKDAMEDSIEIVIEKLLHVTKDVPKVIIFSLPFDHILDM